MNEPVPVDTVQAKHDPIVLVILDGWGLSAGVSGNAIRQANPSKFIRLWHEHPHGVLRAVSPLDETTGLSGSSDTGHASLGTGRLLHADASDLAVAIASRRFFVAPGFSELGATTQANRRTVHVIGFLSDQSSHGRTETLVACVEALRQQQLTDVVIHLILDDDPGPIAAQRLGAFQRILSDRSLGRIGSVSGRSFALDRAGNWRQTRAAYRALIGRATRQQTLPELTSELGQLADRTAQFEPTILVDEAKRCVGPIRAGDTVLLTTTRADRSMQLVRALVDREALAWFGLVRSEPLLGLKLWTLTDFHTDLPDVLPVFRSAVIPDSLGRIVADHGLAQARIASPERLGHVSFYFNGGKGEPFDHEERIIASDEQLTRRTVTLIRLRRTPFIVVNLAAVDQAAHTGNPDATMAAVRATDTALATIAETTLEAGGTLIVTADHGNAESILPSRAGHHHTANGVPWIVATTDNRRPTRVAPNRLAFPNGLPDHRQSLADIAPTVLKLLGIAKPSTMTGKSLV